jgi:hypothetical protein
VIAYQPLPHVDLFHEPRQKVLAAIARLAVLGCGTVHCVQGIQFNATKHPSPRPYPVCMHLFHHLVSISMHMPNGKPELGSSWMDLSKLVSRRESHTSMCGRTLNLGSRDKNSGPRAARMSQTTTSHVAAHPNLLACLNTYSHHSTSSCHTRFICSSDSLTICTKVNN